MHVTQTFLFNSLSCAHFVCVQTLLVAL